MTFAQVLILLCLRYKHSDPFNSVLCYYQRNVTQDQVAHQDQLRRALQELLRNEAFTELLLKFPHFIGARSFGQGLLYPVLILSSHEST